MGLAASQTRFAMLTSRQNDVESRMMHIANQKLSLSRQSAEASSDYSRSLHQTNLVWNSSAGEQAISYNLFNSEKSDYLLTNSSGAVVLSPADASTMGLKTGMNLPDKTTFLQNTTGLDLAKINDYSTQIAANPTTATATTGLGFTTSYTDNEVFQVIGGQAVQSSCDKFTMPISASGVSVACYYNGGNSNADVDYSNSATALHAFATNVCNLAGNGVTTVLKSKYGDKWSSVSDSIATAVENATKATVDFYTNKTSSGNNIAHIGGNHNIKTNGLNNSTDIGMDDWGTDSRAHEEMHNFYVDATQMVRYFLMCFDSECSKLNANSESPAENTKAVETGSNTQTQSDGTKHATSYVMNTTSSTRGGGSTTKVPTAYALNTANNVSGTTMTFSYLKRGAGDVAQGTGGACAVNDGTSTNPNPSGTSTTPTAAFRYYSALYDKMNPNNFVIDNGVRDNKNLQARILTGDLVVEELNGDVQAVSGAASPFKSVAADTTDAQAEYEATKDKIDYKESLLDVEQTNLDSERLAITTEKDSVQKLIDSNVKVFKMFDA